MRLPTLIVTALSSTIAFACPDVPDAIKLSETTFEKHKIYAQVSPPLGAHVTVDNGSFYIDTQTNKLCLLLTGVNEPSCFSDSEATNLEITDDDTGKVTGVVQKNKNAVFVWSVNDKGEIDREKPYLKIEPKWEQQKTFENKRPTVVKLRSSRQSGGLFEL